MPDLPRRRRPAGPSWTEPIVRRLTPAIKALVITDALFFLAFIFSEAAQPWVKAHLALGTDFLVTRQLWQPVTSIVVHLTPGSFLVDIIGLWWLGATVEQTVGTRRFLWLFFVAGILGNIVGALVSLGSGVSVLYEGASFAILAMVVAVGRLLGREQMQIFRALVLEARYLALFFLALAVITDLIRGFDQGDWGSMAGTVVAVVIGYLLAAPGGLRQILDGLRVRRLRRRYRVIEGGAGRRGRQAKYLN